MTDNETETGRARTYRDNGERERDRQTDRQTDRDRLTDNETETRGAKTGRDKRERERIKASAPHNDSLLRGGKVDTLYTTLSRDTMYQTAS